MLIETIQYKDPVDGSDQESTEYFNLTKAECLELNIRNDLEVVGKSKNRNEIMDTFRRILSAAYGVRLSSGAFVKRNEKLIPYFEEFVTTEAYSELFVKLFSDPEYAQRFITAILPPDLNSAAEQVSQSTGIPAGLQNHPSMQGHQQKRRDLRVGENGPAVQPPAIATDQEFEEFLAFKRAKQEREQLAGDAKAQREAEFEALGERARDEAFQAQIDVEREQRRQNPIEGLPSVPRDELT